MSIFDLVPIEYIKAVEVISGPEAAIFGMRGSNGVINIVTQSFGKKPVKVETPNVKSLTRYGFQQPVEFYSPVYETEEQRFNILPDLRTTIYWKPDLVTEDDGNASFNFYASDFPTTYSVVIEGLSDDGMIIRKVEKIKINP